MHVVSFGTYQAENHPRVAVLSEGLRQRGHTTTEANEPLGLSTAERVDLLRSRTGGLRLLLRLARSWTRLAVSARREARRRRPDVVLVGYMGHFDVWLARLLFPRTPVVLDHLIFAASTAQDRGASGSLLGRALRLLDAGAVAVADVVLVDTDEHARLVPRRSAHKTVVVGVGAPDAWAEARPAASTARTASTRLSVVFFGLFTPLQGAETIGRAVALLRDDPVDVTLVGSGQDLDAARAAAEGSPSATWTSWVDSRELPALVARHDVGLGIFGTTAKAGKVVPNKVFQCAAAGTAVVTSDTAPQRRALGDDAVFVPAGDPHALADELRRLAGDPERLADLRLRAAARADRSFTPEAVVEPLEAVLMAGGSSRRGVQEALRRRRS
ncbi:glycosyltransferase involved in cell wall biosynthesis [Frigoribacterium sp. PhB116]|nr:glycosyltransferase involved in cell wall biosynthesis [Frigoribacterium sp. PhB116]